MREVPGHLSQPQWPPIRFLDKVLQSGWLGQWCTTVSCDVLWNQSFVVVG